jgi:iron(III) transport system ATP-binding protein
MNVLEVRHLSKRFGNADHYALHDVSLSVARGEVLAVVGESGSGKTTLLRLVAGLEVPTAGEVLLNGHIASATGRSVPPERRGVGIVFQDYALFPHLNVLDNVTFGLLGLRRTARRNRAMETLRLVGLENFAQRFPHELSGGQQQRVALARALAPHPSLLLLDEPFSNLDIVLKEQVREEVGQILRAAQTTALFVVHDLDDVLAVADRIAILKAGELQQIDTPRAVYEHPADAYVAQLFGSTNLLPGRPRDGGFDTPVGFVTSPSAAAGSGLVTLSIRPQDIEIADDGDAGAAAATIRHTRYRGDYQELVITLAGEPGITHEVRLHTPAERAFASGDAIRVRARSGSVRVLG